MNMKKYLFLGVFITGLLGFNACSDQAGLGIEKPEQPSATGNEVELYVSLQKPGAGSVAYSQIWIDKEADVDTLDVFVFSDKDLGPLGEYTLEQIVPQAAAGAAAAGQSIALQLKLEGRTANRKLYFLANGASISSLKFYDVIAETTEEEFLEALTNATQQQTPLIMTAVAEIAASELATVGADNKYTLAETVELKRVPARIDIQNHERLLIIDSVQMFNTPVQSNIFPQDILAPDLATPVGVTSWPVVNIREHKLSDGAAVDSFWRVPTKHNDPAIGDSVYIPSLYFPYENYAAGDDAKRQRMRIWGRIGSDDLTDVSKGTPVVYEVPLQATGDSIARNFRYILLIHNVLGADLDATLKVLPWEADENDTIIKEVDAATPKVKLNGASLTRKTLPVVQAGETITLQVDCNIQWEVEYEVTNGADTSWITYNILNEDGAVAGADEIGRSLELTFTANDTGVIRGLQDNDESDIWIKVYNKAEPGKFYRFTIKQAEA